jgi:hypothetical protein
MVAGHHSSGRRLVVQQSGERSLWVMSLWVMSLLAADVALTVHIQAGSLEQPLVQKQVV